MDHCIKFIYFGKTLYMFRTVFPSIIRSSVLYLQQHAFVEQILLSAWWRVRDGTPDNGRKDRPKHEECVSKINKFDTLVDLVGFTIGIIYIWGFSPRRS